jgi:hypothetical protein
MREVLDFIVIGAQKSGTSSVFEHLRAHPQLYIPPEKEYPFFSHDEIYAGGWSAFMSSAFCGAPAPDGMRWGTVTPWYMIGCPVDSEGALVAAGRWPRRGSAARQELRENLERIIPERIQARLPAVKLIAILRDPVDRCISHYGLDVLRKVADRKSFDRVIGELLEPATLESSRRLRAPTYVAWGEYGRVLHPYYEVFPREQILVCFTNDLGRAPRDFMREIFDHLGVNLEVVPPHLGTRYRAGATSRRFDWLPKPARLERKLATHAWARSLWHMLPRRTQARLLLHSRQANYRFLLWNRGGRAFDRREVSDDTLVQLRAHYEADRQVLEELIGRPVPWRPQTQAPDPVRA